ncbi:related to G1/S-specific cyclin pas1 [Fusarium torulosum]|uniref:Related to G1/S-specific cyclin pas1 n=1 Tax=Fusarium torulosum TaxID=33205 RepID=A0AAE8SL60_9HYPO|nr:related to G1/S-specific cyclin pas1 [Fusarium torulosum]
MKCDATLSPASITSRYAPYNTSLASSASTSLTSVWSDTTSQASDDTSISTISSDSDSCDSYFSRKAAVADSALNFRRRVQRSQTEAQAVPAELRQNPRRTSGARPVCPPALVRQSDRKVNFVDSLVDSSTQIVEAIWPLSSVVCRNEPRSKEVLPLRTFIQETLRRSRTSYSTLQVALYYLILIKPHVPKHNFTMEQPEDRHADRALQCGRRMFLAALILASKYLQDRNYSARAWSKISGLNTQEINQNEIAFLLAVNWKMHIADEVFQRWTDIVLKYTPPPSGPSSPGGASQTVCQQVADWKRIILGLNPELTNLAVLIPAAPFIPKSSDLCALSPRSILNLPQEAQPSTRYESAEATPTPRMYNTPGAMEPSAVRHSSGRMAHSLGMLPTPRLAPQSSGLCTPAASAASHMLSKSSAMGMAMAQASNINTVQYLDRLPACVTSSPQVYGPVRRSSLANSVSTASSPESMISDTSRSSRSSSISSASSLVSATLSSSKLGVASRFRAPKLCNERLSQKPTIPSVPEYCYTSSPESYTGPVNKLGDLSLDTPLARRQQELEDMARDSDAARALQELHYRSVEVMRAAAPRSGTKRSRTASMDNGLQENVREILGGPYSTQRPAWPDTLVRTRGITSESNLQIPVRPNLPGTGKRVCCSAEAAQGYEVSSVHPAIGIRGPGMWEGILN